MHAKAKNILQKSGFSLFIALTIFLSACKSSQPVSDDSSENMGNESSIETSNPTALDTVKLIQLLKQKEYELANYRGSATRYFDLLHTELDLDFDYQNQIVLGKAILTMKPFFKAQKKVRLDAKDFEMGKVYLLQGMDSTSMNYEYDGKELLIYLPQEFTRNDTVQLSIKYKAFPNMNSGGGSDAITDTKGLYFIDPTGEDPNRPTMIWTQGETEHNSKWFPTFDHPNERMTQLIKLTVPDSMISIGNGEMIKQVDLGNGSHKDYWEMKKPHAPYLAAFAIGDFGKVEDSYQDIPLGYYVEKGFEKGAAEVFKNTPEMIGFFEEKLGIPYPWPKYDQVVVKDFVSGAMENTTVSIFMEELKLSEWEAIDSEWDYIIAHELFHQWFGDYVTTESWANLPLNEAFANYSEYLWNEYKYGRDLATLKLVTEMETYFQESMSKQVDLIRYQYEDSEDMFDSHSYSKGGVILHMLREYLGDDAFFTGLNFYLTEHALSSVEVNDLRQAFEAVTGEDLNWFFNQWFLDKGHPDLMVEIDYSIPENILISITQVQDLETTPLYRLPFEISWYEGQTRKAKTFMLEEAFQQFALENGEATDLVFFDEGKNLLTKKTQEIEKESWVKQFEISELGIARYEALDSLVSQEAYDELRMIIPRAIQDDFWSVRELALGILQGHVEWLAENPELVTLVEEIAKNGKKNSVSSGAIDVLSAFDAAGYEQEFLSLLEDQSVMVSSSALMGLTSLEDVDLSADLVDKFSKETNFRYVIPMAEYFITKPVNGKGDWFQEKIETLSGEGLYFFLGYYSEYFSRFPEEGKENAVKYLLKLMETSGQSFMRLGAFQGLLAFSDNSEVVNEISKIAALEKDSDLKNYFDYFMEALKDEN
ncbi:M1 family metallopeptidase [Algoriphagus sp. YJ13C]|uniref:Aminopeptidase N n=2 Tax=Algoriphagus pacificus TaxID=2811234 RepID=A0ABS3C9U6_9BACT|nr:M1 family metallopeptidase [Algoriphagus pacificus]